MFWASAWDPLEQKNSVYEWDETIDIESLQNRLLKVYVPTTSASFPNVFFAAAINSTNEANKAGSTCHLFYLDVYG
jgi:hypothetical protein